MQVLSGFDIRLARRDQGFSIEVLANRIGVHPATLQRAETGSRPHPDNAAKIAAYFKRKPSELWGE